MSEEIKKMFADISGNYDYMNNVISFGNHHLWRKNLVKISGAEEGQSVLDCASGTGDLAIEFKKAVGQKGKVLATDFCFDMLEYLPPKAKKKGYNIDIEIADAMNLEYKDNSFDYAGISFGIRNVDNPDIALKEMARVVKPGGKVMILETGKPKGAFKYLYNFYNRRIFPLLGSLIAKKKEAYTYLPNSIDKFPYAEEFVKLMKDTGKYTDVKYYPQFFGVSYIYEGIVK